MGERIVSDNVLALGKKLVEQLGTEQAADTLSQWMAHYIAEKIEQASTANNDKRDQKMGECRDAIMKLWTHRNRLPDGLRPFEEFEAIFRVLESLDLDATMPRYFWQVRSAADQSSENDCTRYWLDAAFEIDHAARALIRYCLAAAAEEAADKSRDWVALAEAIAVENDFNTKTVRFIVSDVNMLDPENQDDNLRSTAEDLLKRLQTFNRLSVQLQEKLERVVSEESTEATSVSGS